MFWRRCSGAPLLRVGLKLTAVVLRRQRGSSIPNKRRPMDSTIFDILDAERSVLRRRFAGLFDRSRGTAGHQAFRLHRTVGNIASKPNAHSPRKTAAALSVVVRARSVGRWGVPKKPVRKPGLPETRPRQARTSHRSRRQCIGLFWASSSVLAAEASRSPYGRCATTRPRHLH